MVLKDEDQQTRDFLIYQEKKTKREAEKWPPVMRKGIDEKEAFSYAS